MIFITSDTHGELDRLKDKQLKQLKIGDTLIILGDFGFVWENNKAQDRILKKIAKLPFKTLFIDGVNENFSAINQYPEVSYNGAAACEIYKDKIYYIKRGEILSIEGKSILCFGGGDVFVPDFIYEQSLPTKQDFENCVNNLKDHNNSVDYILTHIPSGKINRFINLDTSHTSTVMEFFDALSDNVTYTKWYFGSTHQDKYISAKSQAVYQNVIQLKD